MSDNEVGLDSRARELLSSNEFLDLVSKAGLGSPVPRTARSLAGRNTNVSVDTETGARLFVKRVDRSTPNTGFEHTIAFEEFAQANREFMRDAGVPTLRSSNPDYGILVYDLIVNTRTLASVFDDNIAFDTSQFEALGRQLATFHSAPNARDSIPRVPHRFPPLASLNALPLTYWIDCSAAELEGWALMQSDAVLIDALSDLRRQEAEAADSPVHGDMRLDQVLIDDTDVYLTDFEDFRLGDPARDIGALLGDITYRAVLSIIKDWSGDFALDADLSHESIVNRGGDALDAQRPAFSAFWTGYRSVTGTHCAALTTRATAWVGWHMFDRLLAAGKDRNRLLSVHRAAAGIGRAALLEPERFSATFEIEEGAS